MPSGLLGIGVLVVSFSGIARMFLSFNANRKLLRVLQTANRGVLSTGEIADRLGMNETAVETSLKLLERKSLVVSGDLLPAGLRIYRVTSRGRDTLAAGAIR